MSFIVLLGGVVLRFCFLFNKQDTSSARVCLNSFSHVRENPHSHVEAQTKGFSSIYTWLVSYRLHTTSNSSWPKDEWHCTLALIYNHKILWLLCFAFRPQMNHIVVLKLCIWQAYEEQGGKKRKKDCIPLTLFLNMCLCLQLLGHWGLSDIAMFLPMRRPAVAF